MACGLVSIYFDISQISQIIKIRCIKLYIIDPEIYSILIFYKKGLGIVSALHFVHGFSRKMFLIL